MRADAGQAGRRAAFAALLLLALLIRMAVPPGYMLAPGAGPWPVVPCDGFGVAAAPADAHGAHGSHHVHGAHHAPPADDAPRPEHKREHPCAFAGLTNAAPPPSLPALPPVVATPGTALVLSFIETIVARGLAAPPPPATGPPPVA